MIKNFLLVLILISTSFTGVAQNIDISQYQDELDLLPASVRSSVLERINSSNFDLPQVQQSESILLDDKDDNEEAIPDKKIDDLEKYDLLQKDYDRYGSLIPKPFGYDLFQNYQKNNLSSFQSAPANYILGPGDELRINFSGSLKASRKVKIDREGNLFLRELGTLNFSGLSYQKAQEELDRIIEASLIGTEAS